MILAQSAAAQDDIALSEPDPAPAIAYAETTRPHLVEDVVYWRDHSLAEICSAFGGDFAKLPNSLVYACTPADSGERSVAQAAVSIQTAQAD